MPRSDGCGDRGVRGEGRVRRHQSTGLGVRNYRPLRVESCLRALEQVSESRAQLSESVLMGLLLC